jgi:Uma2 family endonuclease
MTLAATNLMSAEMLEVLPNDGRRLELVKGELVELMASGGEHGICTHRLSARLGVFVEDHGLGEVFAAETGFIVDRNPDTVRAPDIAFIGKERFEELGSVPKGFIPIAPDLAVETISPNDLYTESHDKALMWLEFGSKLVLLLNPRKASITVYRSKKNIFILEAEDTLEFPDIVPGFSIKVAKIFGISSPISSQS